MRQKWIRDFHYSFAHWLCENYNTILFPEYATSSMVCKRKGQRRINSKAVRGMMNWTTYLFKQRLLYISTRYADCKVHIVDESYTSKTCGRCGTLNYKLGGSKVFKWICSTCDYVCERVINGARNILLRAEWDLNKSHSALGPNPLAIVPFGSSAMHGSSADVSISSNTSVVASNL